jgi:hypothetical protein
MLAHQQSHLSKRSSMHDALALTGDQLAAMGFLCGSTVATAGDSPAFGSRIPALAYLIGE